MKRTALLVAALVVAAAAAGFGVLAAVESHALSTTRAGVPHLLRVNEQPAQYGRPYLNAGVSDLETETPKVRVTLEFPDPHNLKVPNYVALVTALPPSGDDAFALGMESVAFTGRDTTIENVSEPPTAAHASRIRQFSLPAVGTPFLYPWDSYTLRFSLFFAPRGGQGYDSISWPAFAGGGGPGFAGLAITDSIPSFRREWTGRVDEHGSAVYSVRVSRPLMPKLLYVVFFSLAVGALMTAVVMARDYRDLIAIAAGTIGSTWAVRSIVLGGNTFRSATIVDLTAYFVVLAAALAITVRAHRLTRPEPPRELE